MKFEEYLQALNRKIDVDFHKKYPTALLFASNALGGECGELQNIIKKVYRDDGEDPLGRLPDIMLELGDILWCWIRICDILEIDTSVVMEMSIEKLTSRGWLKEKK